MLKLLNHCITLYLVVPGMMLLGIYLTFRLRFIQLTKVWYGIKTLFKKEGGAKGEITHYQAVSSILASNFGTGNISGIAVALAVGGPGALVWMWIVTFFGTVIQYASSLLGVKYREKTESGRYVGGPMYYLKKLGWTRLAKLFAFSVIGTAFFAGVFVQVNSMTLPLNQLGISPWVSGSVIALLVALVVFGGAKRIAMVSATVVPVMAFCYLGTAFVILGFHIGELPGAFKLLLQASVGSNQLVGGVVGYSVIKALTTGIDRGIFATDAGTGMASMLQSESKTKEPVIDGVVALVPPLLVMIVCTTTALVLMVTGVYPASDLQSTNLVAHAFSMHVGASLGGSVVVIALFLFGYTTILAWASCLTKAASFLWGARMVRPLLLLFVLFVPVGALIDVEIAWVLADLSLTTMLLINLMGVTGLSKEVIADTRHFFSPMQEPVEVKS